ncbi:MAG: hypothetical protein V4472_23555, partial [Pseudomonadota bacterium]
GIYTPQEAADMRTQIMTGLNPLRMREERAQAQAREMQVRQMQEQNAQQTTMRNMDAQAFARHIQDHTVTTPGGHEVYVSPHDGKVHVLGNRRQEGADRAQETASQMRQHDDAEDEKFRTHLEHAIKEERGTSATGGTTALTEEQRGRVRERMLRQGFSSDDLNEHRANREDRRTTARIGGEVQRRMDQEASGPNPPAWARNPADRQDEAWTRTQARLREQGVRGAAPAAAPIPDTEDRSGLPQAQQAVLQQFDDLHARAMNSPNRRQDYQRLNFVEENFRKFGSTRAMPPALRQRVEGTVTSLQSSLPALPTRGRRQPPPGPAADDGWDAQGIGGFSQ